MGDKTASHDHRIQASIPFYSLLKLVDEHSSVAVEFILKISTVVCWLHVRYAIENLKAMLAFNDIEYEILYQGRFERLRWICEEYD